MAGKSKEQQEKEFWEEWKVKLPQLFNESEQLHKKESELRKKYIAFIHNYTEIHGVRETARRLEDAGKKLSHSILSKIRNDVSDYTTEAISEIAKAISELEKNEKKI